MNNWKKNRNFLLNSKFKNIDPRRYSDYLVLKNISTKPFLMIAELIDNSISSFENHYGSLDQWSEELKITIEVNFTDEEIKIHDLSVIKDSYIKITDNGFGMNEDTLRTAVKLNNQISNQNSRMNVYGRGLKQSAFFFGIDLAIDTKNHFNESWKIEQMLSKQEEGINAIYIVEPSKSNKKNRGTEITISNIHKKREIRTISAWKSIKQTLEYRYIKFFQKRKLKINYLFYNNEETDTGKFVLVKEYKTTIHNEFIIENWEQFFTDIDGKIERNIKTRGNKIDPITVKKTAEKIKKIFYQSQTNTKICFEFEIDLTIENKKLSFLFWMLPSRMRERTQKRVSEYRGIRLFEGDRAIKHAGHSEITCRPYTDWKIGLSETGTTDNKFAGSCDLATIDIKTQTDKSNFSFSQFQREEFNKQIFSVWSAFNVFVIDARKVSKNSLGKNSTQKIRDILESKISILNKFPSKDIEHIGFDKDKNSIFQYIDERKIKWTIIIKIDINENQKNIFSKRIVSDFGIEMTIFTGHNFWKKMDEKLKSDFLWEAAYPISLMLVRQEIHWLNLQDEEKKQMTPISLFNYSGEILIEKNE